ncbi:putative HTH-type transcriptional regulator YcgE [Actinorhabdospora filicis]|uniref:HTH-type transcriptional regulator YcgE n=1 Tax=Actinorhabdospora filicis TaxID=1785913 RepID=A0A9W6SQJ9_9ACTN|nr:MarR family transcriptional regulator [Actinorhabdospora filicis]GLZ81130.1 putative HTH-type transcriptional regulator YcgE [Actinorhabdospora filicis]
MEELRGELSAEVQASQSAVDDFDSAAAVVLGVNRTDLRCMEYLTQVQTAAPTEVGAQLGLSTGSVTAMLDRLEKLAYITRTPDPGDRRRSIVRATPLFMERAMPLYMPMVEEGGRNIEHYDADQLRMLIEFMRNIRELYERQVVRVRGVEPFVKRLRG